MEIKKAARELQCSRAARTTRNQSVKSFRKSSFSSFLGKELDLDVGSCGAKPLCHQLNKMRRQFFVARRRRWQREEVDLHTAKVQSGKIQVAVEDGGEILVELNLLARSQKLLRSNAKLGAAKLRKLHRRCSYKY